MNAAPRIISRTDEKIVIEKVVVSPDNGWPKTIRVSLPAVDMHVKAMENLDPDRFQKLREAVWRAM